MRDFISSNKSDWDELAQLVRRARKSMRRMTPEELGRIDVLYRRTTVHLSQVASRTSDAQLCRYLNDLAASAHSLIYLPPRQPVWKGLVGFVMEGFARAIARTWRFQAMSLVLILGGAVIAYIAVMRDPLAAYAMMPAAETRMPGATPEQLREILRSNREIGGGGKFLFASFLFVNNLKVGVLAMATGILAAVPTVMLLVYNGMLLGTFVAIHNRAGIDSEMWAWILPHGITEIGAVVLFGGIGLMLGHAVVSPGLRSRVESLRQTSAEATRIFFGGLGMLVAAAIIESYLRQSHLSTSARLAFAASTVVFWVLYIAHGVLRERLTVPSDEVALP